MRAWSGHRPAMKAGTFLMAGLESLSRPSNTIGVLAPVIRGLRRCPLTCAATGYPGRAPSGVRLPVGSEQVPGTDQPAARTFIAARFTVRWRG